MRPAWVLTVPLVLLVTPLAAQTWNSDQALALARRAVERRTRAAQDSALQDYKAQAHGFLFFLAQVGEGLTEPPRLVKADQLELEVYWKAPDLSKQRIVGWRDRADVPNDMVYHRDHLGIVQNNFGPLIRLGEGDEVRDVPHPISDGGMGLYDFALGDTVTIVLPERSVRVLTLRVRPKDFAQSRIVGSVYVDAETADLVRLSVSFTSASYLDKQLEDVSIVLDNALWENRFWLPYRQEIEIRRRGAWLDIPARGIIRARWEIDGYVFNLGLVPAWFSGQEIVALPRSEVDSFPWSASIDAAIGDVAEPVRRNDLERVRAEVRRVAGARVLSGLSPRRLGARRVSDLVRANRVEGLALGLGLVWRAAGDRIETRLLASYGFADRRPKGWVSLAAGGVQLAAYRELRDVADQAVIAPLLNSIAAREFGYDYGDYLLADGATLGLRRALGVRGEWQLTVGRERIWSVAARAAPARGALRANVPLGDATLDFARVAIRRRSAGFAVQRDLRAGVVFEAGRLGGGATYGRAAGGGHVLVPLGATRLLVRGDGGVASEHLPPFRAFVLGGRGTLLGDAFRSWGGRAAAVVHAEWRVPVRGLEIGVGALGRLPAALTLAPYVAAGWADRPVTGTPWVATPGTRVTLGLGFEILGVVRVEAGYGLQSRRARFALDVTRDFWDIL